MSRFDRGHRIAHRELDEPSGGARTGVVEEVIGEEKPRLVVARFEETGEHEAFDERELVDLGSKKLSDGPVILHPRHLWNLLRFESLRLAVLFLCVSSAAIVFLSLHFDWSTREKLIAGIVVFGLGFLVSRCAERKVLQARKAR